ncbi:uncharacterized protein LOC100578215 isoform X2 [Apis mellifera]|uniref:Uncharacterized protein LOC100578215 isoform X2 n=1 Tax=Apis mellifera TaxID=7460 RepID=A0A7M7M4A6_APIME|nr:uncharacterized protein LOC100578215 isoform X2 [Apis mellifera]|eukprot:XP_016767664.1 uncharacterized protein LOC100578215 isoform X2 [Apis mellifera]
MMMRRNVVSLIKFFLMAVFTVFLTVVVFRYVRATPNHEIMTPVALVAYDSSSSKNLAMYSNQNFNNHYQDINEKIDWHDYMKIEEEAKRIGKGEHGKPAFLSPSLDALKEKLYQCR